MPYALDDKLVVGITSRALFDLATEDEVFRQRGLAAYRAYQRRREHVPLTPGTALPLVRALLAINERSDERLVEVVVISRNDADSGARILSSVEHAGLDITRAAFTDGREPWPYLEAFRCNLFLSAEPADVKAALAAGFPAAVVAPPPERVVDEIPNEVRIAFDGDAVLFDAASERVYQQEGLDAFQHHEADRADEPLLRGPFEPLLRALQHVQAQFPDADAPIRIALVTSRGVPAHRRVINTLRVWGVRVDESFFLGGVDKTPVLEQFRPHIFFDDQRAHLDRAAPVTPSAQVPDHGPAQLGLFGQSPSPLAPPGAREAAADEAAVEGGVSAGDEAAQGDAGARGEAARRDAGAGGEAAQGDTGASGEGETAAEVSDASLERDEAAGEASPDDGDEGEGPGLRVVS